MPLLIRQDDLILRLVKDVNDIRSLLRRTVANLPLFDISNEDSPEQITSNQDDYVPGNFDVLRIYSDAPRTITGFRGGVKGRFLRLFNVGNYEITIAASSGSSSYENRVVSPTGFDMIINAGGELLLYYDINAQHWISSYSSNADRISCELALSGDQSIPFDTYTEIQWTSVVKDTGGFFDSALPNIITMPESGWYHIDCEIVWEFKINTNIYIAALESIPATYFSVVDSRPGNQEAFPVLVSMGRTVYLPKGITAHIQVLHEFSPSMNIVAGAVNGWRTTFTVAKA